MIVKVDFYCTVEKKTYLRGGKYLGTRKDIDNMLIKEDKDKVSTKELKQVKKTK
jgi:hypothetical protein